MSVLKFRSRWVRMIATAALVVGIDQLAKASIRSSMLVGERRDVIGPLDLLSVRNRGVAFGAFSGAGIVVLALTAIALAAVLIWFSRRDDASNAWLPAGLILGGACGNLLDRLLEGEVTDFIKLPHWPAFNLADVAITVGVVLLVVVAERESNDA
jgi:signal peptidase II